MAGGRCVLLLLIADGVSVVAGRIDTVINRQKTGLLNIIQGEAEQLKELQSLYVSWRGIEKLTDTFFFSSKIYHR